MKLPEKLGTNIIAIDLETTGLDVAVDRIWEIAIVNQDGPLLSTFVNPGRPIPPLVQEKCHLTAEDLQQIEMADPFERIAERVLALVHDQVVVGHNEWEFDLPLLAQEMDRCGKILDIQRVTVLDTKGLFAKLEPRTLVQAARYFCGEDHTAAHRAEADATMTLKVLAGMHERIHSLAAEVSDAAKALMPQYSAMCACRDARELAEWARPDRRLDWAGKFTMNEQGVPCFGFGHGRRGQPVASDIGFLLWMMNKDFTSDTMRVAAELLAKLRGPGADEMTEF